MGRSFAWRGVGLRRSSAGGRRREGADVHQGRRADLPGEVRGVPPGRFDGPDVARHLSGIAPLGKIDQGARRGETDAAMAHRQERRHPGVQKRSLADRRGNRHDCALGRQRRAAGRPEGHAGADPVAGRVGVELREAVRRPAGSHRQVAVLHDAGACPGRVGQTLDAVGRHGAPLGARDRNPSRDDQRTQDRPSRPRPALAGRSDRQCGRGEQRRRQRRERGPRPLHGMGGRQAGRDHAARHRQAAAPGLAVRLGHSLLRRRRGDHQQRRSASTSTRRARSRSSARCST